ncbi:MAG: hypothetical protein PUF75_06705 [Coprococcus sp.]|nr:hypothetical protein [Coprococcus sp.]
MKRQFLKTGFLVVTICAALAAMTAATYAWFTTNKAVSTGTATARTGDERLELQISSEGGSRFTDQETVSVFQVNQTDQKNMIPVSTDNLVDFVYAPFTSGGDAKKFLRVEREENYYHGRIYLRAVGDGFAADDRLALYLDQSDGILASASSGMLLHASRLGLRFDNDKTVIFRLSDDTNPKDAQTYNTIINGERLGADQVLSYQNGTIKAVADPSVSLSDYTISFETSSIRVPDKPLLLMEWNKIYTLDIYFYLEGCDPDCSDSVSFDQADIHLAFYGMLSQGADK